jgi:hypothetical protein
MSLESRRENLDLAGASGDSTYSIPLAKPPPNRLICAHGHTRAANRISCQISILYSFLGTAVLTACSGKNWPDHDDQRRPLAYREAMSGAMSNGAVTIERCVLQDGTISSTTALDHVSCRWKPTSPLSRASATSMAPTQRPGNPILCRIRPAGLHLCPRLPLGVRWRGMARDHPPTRTGQLETLRILPRNRELLERASWS